MPNRCFCERIRGGVVRQPSNTWSNLGFLLTGLAIVVTGAWDRLRKTSSRARNPMRAQSVYSGVWGAATLLIGIGSMFYHSSMTFAGQSVDVISMYLLISFIAVYNLSRARRMSSRAFVVFYLLLNVALGAIAVHWPVSRRYIFVGLILAVMASEVLCRRRLRLAMKTREPFFYGAIASLAMACVCWVVDITGVMCWSDSWFQAHAAWHLLTAAATGLVYVYYRSEIAKLCKGQRQDRSTAVD